MKALFYFFGFLFCVNVNPFLKVEKFRNQEKKTFQSSREAGKEIYAEFCMQCHLPNGKGTPKTIPPLAGSNWLVDKRTASIHAVKYGQSGPIEVNENIYDNSMPPMGLTDEEVADVMNYIMTSWGNKQKKPVTESEVASIKK